MKTYTMKDDQDEKNVENFIEKCPLKSFNSGLVYKRVGL